MEDLSTPPPHSKSNVGDLSDFVVGLFVLDSGHDVTVVRLVGSETLLGGGGGSKIGNKKGPNQLC